MQTNNKFFDDLTKLASAGAGGLMDAKRELDALIAQQTEKFMQKMSLVTKEEFDTTQAMLAKARLEQEALIKRVEALELCIKDLTLGQKSNK